MAVTAVTGMRMTDGVSSSLIKREVLEAIYNFKPYQTPVTQFFLGNKFAKMATGNPKFELQEDVLLPHSLTTTDAIAGGGASEDDIVVDANYAKVGDVVLNTTTNEAYYVDTVDTSAVDIDITKVGSGNITASAAGTVLLIIGSAFAEGSASAAARSTQGTFPYNYVQILKKAVEMSGTQMATVNYGGSDWVNQRVKATEEFKLDIERMTMFGKRHIITTTSAYRRFSGGFLDTAGSGITDVSQYTGDDFADETYFFNTYCKALFAKGSNEKTLYCGSDAILGINEYSKVKQQTRVAEKEYGVDITTILTPFGRANLVWHPILEGEYSNWVVGVDRQPEYLKYRFLSGNGFNRDLQYQQNIHSAEYDERKDQYLAEIGIHLAGATQGVHRTLYPGA